LEQRFGPKLSRVAAVTCFLLFLGLLDYVFGLPKVLVILLLFLLFVWLLLFLFPKSSTVKKGARSVLKALDLGSTLDWLEERFDKPTKS